MNEQANVALIQRMYAAFAKGDIETILNTVTPDVEWRMDGPEIIPFAGTRRGPSQVMDFFQALGGTQQDQKLTAEQFIAQGDTVVTIGRYAATVKSTGKRMDCAVVHVFTIKDGKVSRFLDFTDTAHVAETYMASTASAGR